MTSPALFADLRPPARPVPRGGRALSLQACLNGPVVALSHEAFRAWTFLRLLPRSTSMARASALLVAHGLQGAVPELEHSGFLVSRVAPSGRPTTFSTVIPVIVDPEALVIAYRPLVEVIARRLLARLPPSVDLDDLISEGDLALVRAVQRYDPRHGVPFGAYARRRLVGALLDALRRWDTLPRRVRVAVTKGDVAWQEVSLDEARDVPAQASSDVRAANCADRRVEALLAALPDPLDRAIVRRLVLLDESPATVAGALGVSVRDVVARRDAALRLLAVRATDREVIVSHKLTVCPTL